MCILNKYVFEYKFFIPNKLTSKLKISGVYTYLSQKKKKKALLESALWFFKKATNESSILSLFILS